MEGTLLRNTCEMVPSMKRRVESDDSRGEGCIIVAEYAVQQCTLALRVYDDSSGTKWQLL
jgi:hypothetical protein